MTQILCYITLLTTLSITSSRYLVVPLVTASKNKWLVTFACNKFKFKTRYFQLERSNVNKLQKFHIPKFGHKNLMRFHGSLSLSRTQAMCRNIRDIGRHLGIFMYIFAMPHLKPVLGSFPLPGSFEGPLHCTN